MILFNDYEAGSPKRGFMHAYQAFYIIFVLAGYWLSAAFNLGEVWDLQDRGARHVGIKLDNAWIASRAKYAFSLRLLHLLTNVGGQPFGKFKCWELREACHWACCLPCRTTLRTRNVILPSRFEKPENLCVGSRHKSRRRRPMVV